LTAFSVEDSMRKLVWIGVISFVLLVLGLSCSRATQPPARPAYPMQQDEPPIVVKNGSMHFIAKAGTTWVEDGDNWKHKTTDPHDGRLYARAWVNDAEVCTIEGNKLVVTSSDGVSVTIAVKGWWFSHSSKVAKRDGLSKYSETELRHDTTGYVQSIRMGGNECKFADNKAIISVCTTGNPCPKGR
jgi:hypothetical protein